MKKIIILAIAFGAFTLTSCKKNWTCVCTVNGQTSETKSGVKLSKKSAKAWCETSGYCKLK
ncbi:MAG TPA: hypothetical protein PKA54_03110 [Chitinophagaceae bacterium]|nr:hypothetical protein [Chitinophagaceae bacterium]